MVKGGGRSSSVEPNNFSDKTRYVANLPPFGGKALVTLRHSLNAFSEPLPVRALELAGASKNTLQIWLVEAKKSYK